jgi:FkbM family methyltransferase
MARVAKFLVPHAATFLSSTGAQSAIALSETAVAMLQGKGAGSGWDIAAEIRAALKFIRRGSTVLDVGANKGDWSRAIQQNFDGDVRLFLFEPQETCYAELAALVRGGAVLVKAAVGETEGSAVLYSPGDRAGNASLHVRNDTYFADQVFLPQTVDVVSIDPFLKRNGIESVGFMKMDVEGHELFALRGARDALSRGAIRALSFEFGSGNINSRTFFRDYWDLLTGYSYNLYRVLPGGRVSQIFRYSEELEYFRGVSNYIAAAGDFNHIGGLANAV